MDDMEYVCPLCCEELDISDREFYPCKCGYQVCMWCWHRIRESESGLCPACRTPYGEDPHQFSAVDVEEVLKANKEKEAAAKRERERQRQHHQRRGSSGESGELGLSDSGDPHGHHGSHHHSSSIEVPKDRSSLANMRVIRRNLVYAVGLPQNVATEETLRKPEYFGQYGRISKIVLSRTQSASNNSSGPGSRASASAYVTFVHKEDTLSCILALDGFYLENRAIRASYGTSKYCSAFIKNVRCNNPECTYLHEMGAPEDTFTKQEIQAGYVTSGRDVLARQQQIVAEQLRQVGGSGTSRKRVGGGGPSGTGRVASGPVFPPPEYDEPASHATHKHHQQSSLHSLVPPPTGIGTRAASSGPTVATGSFGAAAAAGTKTIRSASIGIPATQPQTAAAAVTNSINLSTASSRKATSASMAAGSATVGATTAASVVASGVHHSSVSKPDGSSESHTTLTPLTPLKRVGKTSRNASGGPMMPSSNQQAADSSSLEKLVPLRNGTAGKKQNGVRVSTGNSGGTSSSEGSPVVSGLSKEGKISLSTDGTATRVSTIGGDVIGPPSKTASRTFGAAGTIDVIGPGVDSLGGRPFDLAERVTGGSGGSVSSESTSRSSALGGEVFTGQLPHSTSKSAIGSGIDKWNSNQSFGYSGSGTSQPVGGAPLSAGPVLVGGGSNTNLWGGSDQGRQQPQQQSQGIPSTHSGGVIGSHISNQVIGPGNSSSALASILGINLPTGSGSLQESSNLWSTQSAPVAPSPLAALNGSAIPIQGGAIGGGTPLDTGGSSAIGGVPIGSASGVTSSGSSPLNAPTKSGKSDIALLQSLLPGVHITSGNDSMGFGGFAGGGWGSAPGPSVQPHHHHHHFQQQQQYLQHHPHQGMGPASLNGDAIGNGWGNGMHSSPTSAIGAIGGGSNPVQQNQRQGPGIW